MEEHKFLALDSQICEIMLPLTHPRLIRIQGIDKYGRKKEWLLKITEKGKLVLV